MNAMAERWAQFVIANSRAIIIVFVLLTALFATGIPLVEEERDLGQFETGSPAVNASEFIQQEMFPEGTQNQTPIQVIRDGDPGEDVLTRAELIETIEFQQSIVDHPRVGPMLVEDEPITGIANVIALVHIQTLLQLETSDFQSVDRDEAEALAGLMGFESHEQETIGELVVILDSSDADPELSAENATENEIRTALEAVGFNETQQDTILRLQELVDGEETTTMLPELTSATQEERQAVASLIGVSELPDDDCLANLDREDTAELSQHQPPALSCQHWALTVMNESEFEDAITRILGQDGEREALALMPGSYEPGTTFANAHTFFIPQATEGGSIEDPDGFSDHVIEAQFDVREMGEERGYRVFGFGLLDSELEQSLEDSTFIVIPIALLFVAVVLAVVYRDIYDIVLGVGGILAVLAWTFGFMGWTGIPFNQMMVAVPALLVGLSIDFSLHVFMRHRERRNPGMGGRQAMQVALGGVILALVWVTATAGIGFLSNLVSPIGPLRDFGLVSAFGITASLLIFGALVPAAKVELDDHLESRGQTRHRRAFGTDGSFVSRLLETGARVAGRTPVLVIVIALLLTTGGAYGATQIDTSFEEQDFLAEDPPAWATYLPGPFGASEYQITEEVAYIQENFYQTGREGQLLIEGEVTHDQSLLWLESAVDNATEQESVFILPNDEPNLRSPLSAMENTARFAPDSEFATRMDGEVPTENISGLYAELHMLNPGVADLVDDNSEPSAIRMEIGIVGDISQSEATADVEEIATHLETTSDGALEVTPTGPLIINTEIEQNLFETVIQSLIVTLLVVFTFLAVAYRVTGNTASLGVVTLLPVLCSMAWILGTMWLLDMPFNALTGTIAALTIGLGIDYSIHISDRFQQELRRHGNVQQALQTTVTGTGGALLGTAATTVGGFWTLMLAMMPALQQFGLIIGLTIIYAFLASVLVLPSLLVLWVKVVRPESVSTTETTAQESSNEETQQPAID